MAYGYCAFMSIIGYIVGSAQKSNQLEKMSEDDFGKKNYLPNGKELWKLNWIPPKHLRMDKYYYGDENV